MSSIRQLPPNVVNQIAAGEVIERPASVVKELLENAVDAGASRVDVLLSKGGTESIRVADDGRGIPAEELPLAVTSHATSKLESADDLFRVRTLGFRGEALASIAAVSRLTIRSRPATRRDATRHPAGPGAGCPPAGGAAELHVDAGDVGPVRPAASPPGTTVEVRDLFLNTPVRRKFLRTVATELGHATEAFTRVALAYPGVHFTLHHNGRAVHELPPCADFRERIANFFGADLAGSLIAVTSEENDVRLFGYVANPMHSRTNNRLQYLFLNGRCIRDRSLQHALSEAYRGLLLVGRYPICFLRLEMPPELVDVNVHPTKLEVRFQDGGRLYSQLLGMLRTKFLTVDLKARAHTGNVGGEAVQPGGANPEAPAQLVAWAKEQLQAQRPPEEDEHVAAPLTRPPPQPEGRGLRLVPFAPLGRPAGGIATDAASRIAAVRGFSDPNETAAREPASGSPPETLRVDAAERGSVPPFRVPSLPQPRARALQVHNRYLIAETDDGLEVIDQHALHERILYEELRERVLSGPLESQRLLVPEPIDLSPAESAAALDHRELLAELGLAIEPFGGDTILVASYPAMLANMQPAEVLRELLEHLTGDGKKPERRDVLDRLLHSIACKAAVKYGDYLTPEEIDSLLEQRHLARDHHHCPHGRPTALVFTREDLDRQFKRL